MVAERIEVSIRPVTRGTAQRRADSTRAGKETRRLWPRRSIWSPLSSRGLLWSLRPSSCSTAGSAVPTMPKIKIDPLTAITGFQVRKPRQNGANNSGCCISDTRRQLSGANRARGGSPWDDSRRRSLSEDRGPAPDSNMTGRVLSHSFIHDVQRALGVVCYADDRGAIFREQLDFEFAHKWDHKTHCFADTPSKSARRKRGS
jgi:hypothetical protein